jgi:glycosyltransferase involved in cell wall biosynthesis
MSKLEGGYRIDESQRENRQIPLVSIITVVKNGESHLAHTIQSVLDQHYENIEYIIVDGQSNDGTIDIIRSQQAHIAYWVSEADKGISDAFNKGIELARGDIVGIINADDWFETTAVSDVTEVFKRYPDCGVVCGSMSYWRDGHEIYTAPSVPSKLARRMTIHHPTTFVRRTLYQQHGGFRAGYYSAMDYELMVRFFSGGEEFRAVDKKLANMRLSGESDINWRRALQEVCRARANNGTNAWMARLGYLIDVMDRSLQLQLDRLGLLKIIPRLKYTNITR